MKRIIFVVSIFLITIGAHASHEQRRPDTKFQETEQRFHAVARKLDIFRQIAGVESNLNYHHRQQLARPFTLLLLETGLPVDTIITEAARYRNLFLIEAMLDFLAKNPHHAFEYDKKYLSRHEIFHTFSYGTFKGNAAYTDYEHLIRLLKHYGYKLDNVASLSQAFLIGDITLARVLLSNGIAIKPDSLFDLILDRHENFTDFFVKHSIEQLLEIIFELVDQGVDINYKSPRHGNKTIFEWFESKSFKMQLTALTDAKLQACITKFEHIAQMIKEYVATKQARAQETVSELNQHLQTQQNSVILTPNLEVARQNSAHNPINIILEYASLLGRSTGQRLYPDLSQLQPQLVGTAAIAAALAYAAGKGR